MADQDVIALMRAAEGTLQLSGRRNSVWSWLLENFAFRLRLKGTFGS